MNANRDDDEIESLLKRQPLRVPSAAFDERMEQLFAQREVFVWPVVRWAAALAACAGIAVTVWYVMSRNIATTPVKPNVVVKAPDKGANPATPLDFDPVRIEQVWSQVEPEGVIMVDGDAMRRFHRQMVEHVQLIDDARNIRIEYTVPHNDVIVMPVRYD